MKSNFKILKAKAINGKIHRFIDSCLTQVENGHNDTDCEIQTASYNGVEWSVGDVSEQGIIKKFYLKNFECIANIDIGGGLSNEIEISELRKKEYVRTESAEYLEALKSADRYSIWVWEHAEQENKNLKQELSEAKERVRTLIQENDERKEKLEQAVVSRDFFYDMFNGSNRSENEEINFLKKIINKLSK